MTSGRLDVDLLEHRTSLASLLERRAAEYPDRVFMRIDAEEMTFADAVGRARSVANQLVALGVQPGETAAYFAPTSLLWFDLMIGAPLAGVVASPVNTAFRGDYLVHQLRDSEAVVLIVDAPLLPILGSVIDQLASLRVLLVRGTPDVEGGTILAGLTGLHVGVVDELYSGRRDIVDGRTPLGWEDPAYVFYTSGTTGPSKGAQLTSSYLLSFGATHCGAFGHTPDDRFYGSGPVFHLSGAMLAMAALVTGGTSTLDSTFSPQRVFDRIREVDATVFIGVGAMVLMMYNRPPDPDEATLPLRLLHAAPIPVELHAAIEERWGVKIASSYGMTEAMPIFVHDVAAGVVPGSSGKITPRFEVRIVDDNDDDVPVGEIGEIICRPRTRGVMFEGYRGRPEATLGQLRGLWFHTGDYGRRDAEGNFFFVDRKKDAIRRRGENISSFEVERAVLQFPAVAEVAAHAVPSDLGEDEVKVCVVLKPDVAATAEELHAHCVATMPKFAVPRYIEFMAELPKNAVGRVQKVVLRGRPLGPETWDAVAATTGAR